MNGPCSLRCLRALLWLLLLPGGCDRMEARSLVKEGNAHYQAGRFHEAIQKYGGAARLDPDFPTLHLNLGYACLAAASASPDPAVSGRRVREAGAAFERYMRLRPRDERGPKFYLQTLIDGQQLEEALRFLAGLHRKNPRDVKIVASLGMVSSKAGRFLEALKWYEHRAALLPGEAEARYLIGTLCWEHLYQKAAIVGAERVRVADRGIAALRQALVIQPGYAEALVYVNLLYRERAKGQSDPAARERDLTEARRFYEQAKAAVKRSAGKTKESP